MSESQPSQPNVETDAQIVRTFMAENPLAVIATVGKGSNEPESAVVAFAETEKLEIIFNTNTTSRKYPNISSNPCVSFTIGWDPKYHRTLQYEGTVREVSAEEHAKYRSILLAKKTPIKPAYIDDPAAKLFVVTPTWLRYGDYTKQPPQIIELNFVNGNPR